MADFGEDNCTGTFGDSWRSPGQFGDFCEFHIALFLGVVLATPDFI